MATCNQIVTDVHNKPLIGHEGGWYWIKGENNIKQIANYINGPLMIYIQSNYVWRKNWSYLVDYITATLCYLYLKTMTMAEILLDLTIDLHCYI